MTSPDTMISTLRLRCRPSFVLLSATGSALPSPIAVSEHILSQALLHEEVPHPVGALLGQLRVRNRESVSRNPLAQGRRASASHAAFILVEKTECLKSLTSLPPGQILHFQLHLQVLPTEPTAYALQLFRVVMSNHRAATMRTLGQEPIEINPRGPEAFCMFFDVSTLGFLFGRWAPLGRRSLCGLLELLVDRSTDATLPSIRTPLGRS
jgi:hypothetical protein